MWKVKLNSEEKILPIRATAPALTTRPSPNKIKSITGGAPSFMNTVAAGGPRIYQFLIFLNAYGKKFCSM